MVSVERTPAESRARLQRIFTRYADVEVPQRSPLYEVICRGVVDDPEMLDLAAEARPGQPVPNLLLAAVHDLLLRGVDDPLAAFYADLTPNPRPREDAYPYFRAFALAHREQVADLIRTRIVQTSQVRRCTSLVPAFALVQRRAGGLPVALLEVGPSAGLNLLLDRYAYAYSDGTRIGDPSELTLTCDLHGERPPLPAALPAIGWRLGLDLNPIDVRDDGAVRWLRALTWPGEEGRLHDLNAALAIARRDPPELLRGDALQTLPAALDRVPSGTALLVYHSMTLNQFSREGRAQFDALLRDHGRRRPLWRVAMEALTATSPEPSLDLFSYADGGARQETLGECDAHGAWLAWSGPVA